MAGCRDCNACTAALWWRMTRLLLITWWLWMFKTVVRTCPQCRHTMGRHNFRRDGSFRD